METPSSFLPLKGAYRSSKLALSTQAILCEMLNVITIFSDHISEKIQKYNKLLNGKQRGNPDKAAEIMVKLANNDYGRGIPIRLALGTDSYDNIVETYHENLKSADEWKDVSCSTDFDDFTPGPKNLE